MQHEIAREPLGSNAGSPISRIPFSAFPNQSRLFLAYLRDPGSLTRFYPNAVSSPSGVDAFASVVLSNYLVDRSELCDALAEINSEIGAGPETLANIELLRESDTVAVLTGQQAGIFAGPLYTIYKALSAVRMAESLNARNVKAVPVFWAATEDHDFEEVSTAWFLNGSGELMHEEYVPRGDVGDVPVGKVEVDVGIVEVLEDLFSNLPETAQSVEVRDQMATAWKEGASFGHAFTQTLAGLLRDYGVVFVDPLNGRLKTLAAPIYVDAVRRSDEIVNAVIARGRELEGDGYHTQVEVKADYFPLFWHDDLGRRLSLRKIGDDRFRAKGLGREFDRAALELAAGTEPNRFSPGVMLRPVVQDYLLPTICYFGGAAEIAYFAQNSEVSRVLDRPVTPIFHRQSFTLVESRHRKVLRKFDLEIPDLFVGVEQTLLDVATRHIPGGSAELFAMVEEAVNIELDKLDKRLSSIDPTLAASLGKRRRKIVYHIAALQKKTLLAEVRSHETVERQISSLFASLLPNGELQERSLNVFSFINKYGIRLIDIIYKSVDLEDKSHRVIDL